MQSSAGCRQARQHGMDGLHPWMVCIQARQHGMDGNGAAAACLRFAIGPHLPVLRCVAFLIRASPDCLTKSENLPFPFWR